MAEEITIVISAPSDVQPEYEQLVEEIEALQMLAKAYGVTLNYRSWQKDSQPGANTEGRQAHVEAILNIPICDLFIAILWKQFVGLADCGPTNTRLDFDCAYEAWKASLGRPDLYVYFRQSPYQPTSSAEAAQWAQVLKFHEDFPNKLTCAQYQSEKDFRQSVRRHLTNYILRYKNLAREKEIREAYAEVLASQAKKEDEGISDSEKAKQNKVKGDALENLMRLIFENVDGFIVKYVNHRTESEEIDLVIVNRSNDPAWRDEGYFIEVECKNLKKSVARKEFDAFRAKVKNRRGRCKLGYIVTTNVFSKDFKIQQVRNSEDADLIALIDGDDLKDLVESTDRSQILRDIVDRSAFT